MPHGFTRDDAPLRSELLTAERLGDLARALAHGQESSTENPPRSTPLLDIVAHAAASLEADAADLGRDSSRGGVPPAAEWLLDNHYLIEEQILLVRSDLPDHYGVELPRRTSGPFAGLPRVYEASLMLIEHTDSRLEAESLLAFVRGFQEGAHLTIGEVWAVPIMLRIGIVENLRRLSRATAIVQNAERDADRWIERVVLTAQDRPDELAALLAELDAVAQSQPVAFLLRLSHRSTDVTAGADQVNSWLGRALDRAHISLDRDAADLQSRRASDQVSIANAIGSVRFLDAYDWRAFFEEVSVVEAALRNDPATVYARMDFESRDRYRHALELMARRCPLSEHDLATQVVAQALAAIIRDPADTVRGHVGWWLIGPGRYLLEERVGYRPTVRERMHRGPMRNRTGFYFVTLALILACTLALLALYGVWEGGSPGAVALLVAFGALPLSEIAVAAVNRLTTALFPPRQLPKLDPLIPVAEEHRTLVVVAALITSPGDAKRACEHLEIAYLANKDSHLGFGLVGDLRAARSPRRPEDDAIIETVVRGIAELNARYETPEGTRPFHLLLRHRTFGPSEGVWMGWERKRGALIELVREMREDPNTSFQLKMGDAAFRRSCAFVTTLDSDTQLPRDTAKQLIGAIAHPMNRAHYARSDAIIRQGYGLIQPRVGMSLPGAQRSLYAMLHSGRTGVDPYAAAVSDTYQDLFDEGSFTGKGVFDVDAFHALLDDRFPDATLLSHDLIEGSFLRTGLASDIEVIDDHPSSYLASAKRLHRWIRGDWQTLPYLAPRITDAHGIAHRNPLTAVHRWKIADNLRRSLVAPSTLALFVAGWLVLPRTALTWPLVTSLIVLFPAYFSFVGSVAARPERIAFSTVMRAAGRDLGSDSLRGLFGLVVLPHQAWLSLDAAVRAVWRRFVTHRNLLEWETAADSERRAGTTPAAFARVLGPAAVVAALGVLASSGLDPLRIAVAAPVVALWLCGPIIAHRLSAPLQRSSPPKLTDAQRAALRRTARKTWRYFETFVTPEGHHLVPDNYQEDPGEVIAWRTSPTNVGLQLLAQSAAYDLGYSDITRFSENVARTLSTLAGLERFNGHFLNWYDIRTLEPLRPAYVSTVDSGNLAGHLITLRVALLQATEAPLLGPQLIDGALDAIGLALETLSDTGCSAGEPGAAVSALQALCELLGDGSGPATTEQWLALRSRLIVLADQLELAAMGAPGECRAPIVDAMGAARVPVTLIDRYLPWVLLLSSAPAAARTDPALEPLFGEVPSLVDIAEGLSETIAALRAASGGGGGSAAWASHVAASIGSARTDAVELLATMRLSAEIAREMWEHTDFSMLFDENRQLFSIGYNLERGGLDPSYYDLLASECRLASFLSVAKGDVAQSHWFRLGRALTRTPQGEGLVSWSASMFEYLMPLLIMRDWPGTLLDRTYRTVVRRQIAYGHERGVPWGVSESAFNAKDAALTYQYQAFGVPGLGLKRGLRDDIVVAPYAAMLCLPIDPHAVVADLEAFSEEGAEGYYGYYESLDYTPGRAPAGKRRAVIAAYFAHHQGMAFVAITNALRGDPFPARFHADPVVASAELLLQERVPRHAQVIKPHVEELDEVRSVRELPPPVTRSYAGADTPVPATHFLSNGRYSVMVTNGGGGYSSCDGIAVTRYREDVTRDCWGTFFFVRDLATGEVFSAPHNPAPARPDDFHCTFAPDKAEFVRMDGTLETRVEIAVSPEDDVEVRRLALSNRSLTVRELEVTSYFEIALAPQGADQAHKAFSNLFIETEPLPETRTVLFSRRPRSAEEPRRHGIHVLACEEPECDWSYETDRAAFLGRLRGVDSPTALEVPGPLGRSHGAVLDPCCAARRTVRVHPGETVRIAFFTGVADSRDGALRLAEKYHDARSAQRVLDLAWTAAQLELRDLGITPAEAVILERLGSRLLLTDPYSPLKVKTPAENGLRLDGLWSLGISGDHPILLVRVEEIEHAPLVRQALLAHQYWRHKGLVADLVVLNTRPTAYTDELDDRLRLLVRTGHALQLLDRPGGVFLRRADQMHPDVLNLLLSVARATLDGDRGTLELQLNRRATRPLLPGPLAVSRSRRTPTAPGLERPGLACDNGFGGFDTEGGDYVIVLDDGDTTPAPWINVLASPTFGCTVSEAGVGCTWAQNSHENRITTWNNDPVSDGSGEAFYLRDEETGEFWSPTPLPVRAPGPYVVRHGYARTRFEHTSHDIAHTLDWFVDPEQPVRIARLRLRNLGEVRRQLSVTQFVEWVLGDSRSHAQQLVVTWYDAESEMLTAHNHMNFDFPGRCAFVACDHPISSWTASRSEFVGRNGRASAPAAMRRARLGEQSGRFHDNCGALMAHVTLPAGGSLDISFFLGQTDTLDEARTVVHALRAAAAPAESMRRAARQWDDLTGRITVRTPDTALDALVNGRLVHQMLACRLWGRTATYQSSGAFGFRDQLQDALGVLLIRPDIVRNQILEACRHQFEEGDVQHWWQPGSNRGVRTHISDDRHWLPLAVAEYVEATGDTGILDEHTAFLSSPPLPLESEDAYVQPSITETTASVYEHCIRALEMGRPVGAHGLPLIGGADWNDGMNRVGKDGRGESVWLAWFLGYVLQRFAPIARARGGSKLAADHEAWVQALGAAAEEAWDGAWYRRAYFDDGTPLGSEASDECRIDAIAQAWATISGLADPERAARALQSVDEHLVDREQRLIALLAPPFDHTPHDPGYIKGYVPGVRENGGQYTHAALWVVLAHLLRGDGDTAYELLDLVNPVTHALTREAAEHYVVEPYVVAADVYTAAGHPGRGGWTWYTGSASWFYRVVVNGVLGFSVRASDAGPLLVIDPCIPSSWPGFELDYRFGTSTYRIIAENPGGAMRGVGALYVDGAEVEPSAIALVDDGATHTVRVLLGGS
jgi:cellobiose phosphorylase